jgi:hypothetical protein
VGVKELARVSKGLSKNFTMLFSPLTLTLSRKGRGEITFDKIGK